MLLKIILRNIYRKPKLQRTLQGQKTSTQHLETKRAYAALFCYGLTIHLIIIDFHNMLRYNLSSHTRN